MRWTTADRTIVVREPLDQPAAAVFKVDRGIEYVKRTAKLAETIQMLLQLKETPLIHSAPSNVNDRVGHENLSARRVSADAQLVQSFRMYILIAYSLNINRAFSIC